VNLGGAYCGANTTNSGETTVSDAAIQRVGVIGAGQMGSGIAEVSVRAGVAVTVFETTDALITAGRNRIIKSL